MSTSNRIHRRPFQAVALWLLLQATLAVPAVAWDVLAHVDGEPITTQDLDRLLKSQKRPEDGDASHLTSEGVVKRLVQNRLLEQEGYRTGVHEKPEIKNQVWDLVRHRGMMALLDSISGTATEPDPDSLNALFSMTNVIYRIAHILVESEETAVALKDSLAAGIAFSSLAARHSRDTTFAGEGGDLGWAKKESFVPEFADALEGLSVGEVSDPFQSSQGWHLLRLTDSRTETVGQSDKMMAALRKAASRAAERDAHRSFIASLKEKYEVEVDTELLASLDYGSADADVQEALREREDVLVELPWRNLLVKDLTRIIRFEHFHGLQGKPDAAAIRDEAFELWLNEVLLRHEASVLGFDEREDIVEQAEQLERRLVREHVIEQILDVPFAPSREELEAYYEDHEEKFAEEAEVRVSGVLLPDEPSARRFSRHLDDGARFGWLVSRTPEVIDTEPEGLTGWVETRELGLSAAEAVKGRVLGPLRMEDAWAVAQVMEVSPPSIKAFEECTNDVAAAMKGELIKETVSQSLALLESEAEIVVAENANELIAGRINVWLGESVLGDGAPSAGSSGGAR